MRQLSSSTALALSLALATSTLTGCGSDEPAQSSDAWDCTAERNGWSRCQPSGEIAWCHGTRAPHFHSGEDCGAAGLSCEESVQGQAACVSDSPCEASDTRCEDGKAYSCVGGTLRIATCGTLQVCAIDGALATCQSPSVDEEPDCGGHGAWHDDHCHCDAGYVETNASSPTCVPEQDAPLQECAGHGELHGDHCHCDDGYMLDPADATRCIAQVSDELNSFPLTITRALARLATDSQQGLIWSYLGYAGNSAQIEVQNYTTYGGPDALGSYIFSAADESLADCGVCVRLETQCHSHGDHLHCDKTYMPKAGASATFTALGRATGERFAGSLEGVIFQEVTIDPSTLATTPVAGAPELRLAGDSFAWDEALRVEAPPAEVCGGHGHLHGDACHCDAGYRLNPQDPRDCIPQ